MASILFNNRFTGNFPSFTKYSRGFVTNALYSKTTAVALVATAAVAGIALWQMYRSQNKVNQPVTRVAQPLASIFTQLVSPSVSHSKTVEKKLMIPTPYPEKGNISVVQAYLGGLSNTRFAQMAARLSAFAASDQNPQAFCSRIESAVSNDYISLEIGQHAINAYLTKVK